MDREAVIKVLGEIDSALEEAWEKENDFQLNEDKVENAQNRVKLLICEITEHNFILDQCGYWQHAFCVKCGQPEYPDLIVKSCGELSKEMGKMTEEEYLKEDLDKTK